MYVIRLNIEGGNMKIDLDFSIKDNFQKDIEKIELDDCLNRTSSRLSIVNEELIDTINQTVDVFMCSDDKIKGNVEQLIDNFNHFDQNIAKEIDSNDIVNISKSNANK